MIRAKVGMVQINLHIWRLLQKGQTRGSVERSAGVRKYKTKHINPATVKLKVKIDRICRCNKKINLACNDMKQIIKPIMF